MKSNLIFKIIFFILICFNLFYPSNADVLPYYINSLRRYGIGYTQVQSPVNLRNAPDGNIIETLNFDFKTGEVTCLVNKQRWSQDELFSVFSQSKKLAFLAALDES